MRIKGGKLLLAHRRSGRADRRRRAARCCPDRLRSEAEPFLLYFSIQTNLRARGDASRRLLPHLNFARRDCKKLTGRETTPASETVPRGCPERGSYEFLFTSEWASRGKHPDKVAEKIRFRMRRSMRLLKPVSSLASLFFYQTARLNTLALAARRC